MENSVKSKWVMDPAHSEVAFKVKHLMITNVKGVFKEFNANVEISDNDFLTSEIDFSLNAASIETGATDRDNHLRSADFFDVENYKQIKFVGKSVEKTGSNEEYVLVGDLTIKGISKDVKLDVEFSGLMKDPWGNEKAGYSLNGKINRKDWNLNWNAALEAGGVLVGDEVKINCEVQLVKQS